jgi:hypothetical protein
MLDKAGNLTREWSDWFTLKVTIPISDNTVAIDQKANPITGSSGHFVVLDADGQALDGGDNPDLTHLQHDHSSVVKGGTLPPLGGGTFPLSAAVATTVPDTAITANSFIAIFPTNAAAATLMGSAKSLYESARVAGASFTVSTASGVAAAGTETFEYVRIG